ACSTRGRPAIGCNTFGRLDLMRVPSPAARMTVLSGPVTALLGKLKGLSDGPRSYVWSAVFAVGSSLREWVSPRLSPGSAASPPVRPGPSPLEELVAIRLPPRRFAWYMAASARESTSSALSWARRHTSPTDKVTPRDRCWGSEATEFTALVKACVAACIGAPGSRIT